ncbi:MAG: thiamine pyrophosphate-binding protein [Flavobacteriales bacterium]|nr:thiamine pyrophosphate-binding protein [Flavobacteriales bacterium]
MNGGEIISNILQQQGIRFLFTLCGGHVSPIFVSAERLGIRVIDTRHEATAVFAADAVSRLTGVPGVAVVTAGPGLTNTVTAVKNALLAQSPLILLGGAAATMLRGRGALQDINQLELMRPNVKWATSIKRVCDIPSIISKAFRVAQDGVPGPVFVECPIDLLYDESLVKEWYGIKSKEVPPRNIQERFLQWYLNRHAEKLFAGANQIDISSKPIISTYPHHSQSHIEQAEKLIQKAKRPIMLIGSGAMMLPQKADILAESVQKLGIPVYLSGMARGLLGKVNRLQMRHNRKQAIRQSDLVILAGVPNDFRLDYGNHIGHRPFISINRSKKDLYQNKRPSLAIHADPMAFLIDLGKASVKVTNEWISSLTDSDAQREISINNQASEDVGHINPIQLFRIADSLLSDSTILIADGGDFVATSAYTLKARSPLSWLDPGVFGTLGVGAGFALGAKLVYPEKDIWIIFGDGSAGYSLMEYDTFVRHNLPVVSLIGNDACWSQIARDQVDLLKSHCATRLAHSDYHKISEAFGGYGIHINQEDKIAPAIEEAIRISREGKPCIINAIIGKTEFRKGSISM